MLFCVFHPSELEGVDNEYIYIVRLVRDIKLLFLIKDFCYKNKLFIIQNCDFMKQ